ncbi:uncharacterized protein LOC111905338 [Lactuca sativa]|uniref:J domain-containing protein n=1 Tax=Lactuca sativa TaxID=4236 RepID=A0A9R1X7Y7_LACSA|nr:uncharacterized protein LOC111905338 [Lactuca sativa]KAJ0202134.1 hypothetical protein LSAT_V11C600312950 [Lactuca sativa]
MQALNINHIFIRSKQKLSPKTPTQAVFKQHTATNARNPTMQSRLFPVPTSIYGTDTGSGTIVSLRRSSNRNLIFLIGAAPTRQRSRISVTCAISNSHQNHYAVLGVSAEATTSDIKKAYRLLARKYHPDVNKDSQASEMFKGIRLAYEVLSNSTTRHQYDNSLHFQPSNFQPSTGPPWRTYNIDLDDINLHKWSHFKQKMNHQKWYDSKYRYYPFDDESEDEEEDANTLTNERHSFTEVLKSTFLSIFLLKTIGAKLSLTFSSLMALLDPKLDGGYKVGYVVAWMLGGKSGIVLTLCLSFASWVCGKTSSNVVALVVVSMWVGSYIARFAPIPHGALLALLYMSIKLQAHLH